MQDFAVDVSEHVTDNNILPLIGILYHYNIQIQKSTGHVRFNGGEVYLELERRAYYQPSGPIESKYYLYLYANRANDVEQISVTWTVNITWENQHGKTKQFSSHRCALFPSDSAAEEITPLPSRWSLLNICVEIHSWNVVRKSSRKRARSPTSH